MNLEVELHPRKLEKTKSSIKFVKDRPGMI